MSQIRIYTDEDIYAAIAPALRQAGIDAISTPEVGRRGESDEEQLAWAANESRTIVSFNVADFAALHVSWQQQGLVHAGIVVSSQRSIGDLLRRLLHVSNSLDADGVKDQLIFLSDW